MTHSKNLIYKKILITGIDSFTGTHLSKYLENSGYEVYGTSLFKSEMKTFQCDLTNLEDVRRLFEKIQPDFLIHLAGISFAAHGKNEDFYKVNILGTTNILDNLVKLEKKPEKVLLASSATVYGNQGLEVLEESLCPIPANHYGASKYAMECMARNYFNKLPIIITRPFNYTGVGQADHFLIPKIVKHYKEKQEKIELGNLDVSREFNDIHYVCEIYKRLLECKTKSEIVNISSNKAIKLLDVIAMMDEIAGYDISVEVNPLFVRKDEIKSLTGSTENLYNLIGKVEERDIKDTLREMFEA